MKRRLLSGLILWMLMVFQAGCLSDLFGQSAPADPAAEWLRGHAHPVAPDAASSEDLAFLKPILEGRRIVQLGENGHGMAEYSRLKARLVQFLHQEMEFDVLIFESALYQCYDADRTAQAARPVDTLMDCTFGVWHTEEVLPLFDYLRTTRQHARPLRLAGMDIQPIGRNKADRPQFLADIAAIIDASYADEVRTLDSTFLAVYARGGRARRAYFRSDSGAAMAAAYDRLAALLETHQDTLVARYATQGPAGAPLMARQTAASMARYIRQQAAPTTKAYVERRDEGMAQNMRFLLDEVFRGQKVIVWGHNFHLRHANVAIPPDSTMFPDVAARTMGTWLHERYGDDLYTVGLYAYQGRAADNSRAIYEIPPGEPGSVEALLHRAGRDALFVDAASALREPGTAWMYEPHTARYNGTNALSMVVRDQYDGILFVNTVTPPVYLY